MTELMNNQVLEDLASFIVKTGGFADDSEAAERLCEQTQYVEQVESHNACRECGANITKLDADGEIEVICSTAPNDHVYRLNPADAFAYRLRPGAVLHDIAAELGHDDTVQTVTTPEYAAAAVADDLRVALVCRANAYGKVLDTLFADGVREGRVNAVFTPVRLNESMWDAVMGRPVASVAPPFSLSMLTVPDKVARQIVSTRRALKRSEDILSRRGDKDDDLVRWMNQNPRMVQSELGHAPFFREMGAPDSGRLSARFETVCEAAFATIDFGTATSSLGTDSRGKNITDIVFDLSESCRLADGGEKILGIVDAKSGAKTDIKKERIVNKHAEYLQQANTRVFDDHHVAHVFVVLSMQGYSSNEIDWFDGIEEEYCESDATMVVLYADALAQMVDMHVSAVQRNEANLSVEDFSDVLRPFFNYRAFRSEVNASIREITRLDGDDCEQAAKYRQEYRERSRLLVVTEEMVDRHFYSEVDQYDMVRSELDSYGDAR